MAKRRERFQGCSTRGPSSRGPSWPGNWVARAPRSPGVLRGTSRRAPETWPGPEDHGRFCAMRRRYEPNPKHKRGASGDGPPRWFPSRDSLCPDHFSLEVAQALLDEAVEAADPAHPNKRALHAMHEGEFYKAYSHHSEAEGAAEEIEVWHGYPVRREVVPTQVPCRVLREFVKRGRLTRAEYKRFLGSAR